MDPTQRRAIEFFAEHAGYSSPPGRMVCAKLLAEAEQTAKARGWTYVWEWDDDPDLGDHIYWCDQERKGETHTHDVEVCVLRDVHGEIIGSLGGIIDPSPAYRRVVEAELASEAPPRRPWIVEVGDDWSSATIEVNADNEAMAVTRAIKRFARDRQRPLDLLSLKLSARRP